MKKLLVLLLSLCCLFAFVGCDKETKEDINAKSEGVMTWAEYDAAAKDDAVVVECYVQGHQNWWNDKITVYAQDKDGGYLMYEMACSEEDAAKLVPGTKIKVTGTKTVWSGEVEINSGCTFEIEEGSYIAEPIDVTGKTEEEMIKMMNMLVSFSNMTVEDYDGNGAGFGYKSAQGDDLYFSASANGVKVNFCIESYLTGADTEVYKTVESLKAGDVIDVIGFLYWYNGANPHVTGVEIK